MPNPASPATLIVDEHDSNQMPLLGVSSCLLGHKVRYDGNHQQQPLIDQYIAPLFQLIHFCPEVAIGLGVPRPKIQLCERGQQIVCLDQASETIDFTQSLAACCDSERSWLETICGYIFKTKSPSCGVTKVKTRYGKQLIANGQGIFARELIRRYPTLPVIEEDQLADITYRTRFIERAITYSKNRKF